MCLIVSLPRSKAMARTDRDRGATSHANRATSTDLIFQTPNHSHALAFADVLIDNLASRPQAGTRCLSASDSRHPAHARRIPRHHRVGRENQASVGS